MELALAQKMDFLRPFVGRAIHWHASYQNGDGNQDKLLQHKYLPLDSPLLAMRASPAGALFAEIHNGLDNAQIEKMRANLEFSYKCSSVLVCCFFGDLMLCFAIDERDCLDAERITMRLESIIRSVNRLPVSIELRIHVIWLSLLLLPATCAAIGDFGSDTCMDSYVWREACGPGDHVCVTPQTRAQARADNEQAQARKQPGGGAYGPDTCKQGYVWREACGSGDHICVPPQTRTQASQDNAQAAVRRKYPFCDRYAKDAVSQNEVNSRDQCGLAGARWQSNYGNHFGWCLNVLPRDADAERGARQNDLANCANRGNYNCAHCNDGSCQCGYDNGAALCASHKGDDPSIGCIQQQ